MFCLSLCICLIGKSLFQLTTAADNRRCFCTLQFIAQCSSPLSNVRNNKSSVRNIFFNESIHLILNFADILQSLNLSHMNMRRSLIHMRPVKNVNMTAIPFLKFLKEFCHHISQYLRWYGIVNVSKLQKTVFSTVRQMGIYL